MRLIALNEDEIRSLFDKLKLTGFEIKGSYKAEHADFVDLIHKKFHYELVKFFQAHGSNYPNK